MFQTLLTNLRRPAFWGIVILAGFLATYHLTKLVSLYAQGVEHTTLVHVQSVIRILIVANMFALLLSWKHAIWAVWLSVLALVVSQYLMGMGLVAYTVFDPAYLRGLIIPTLITGLLWYHNKVT